MYHKAPWIGSGGAPSFQGLHHLGMWLQNGLLLCVMLLPERLSTLHVLLITMLN